MVRTRRQQEVAASRSPSPPHQPEEEQEPEPEPRRVETTATKRPATRRTGASDFVVQDLDRALSVGRGPRRPASIRRVEMSSSRSGSRAASTGEDEAPTTSRRRFEASGGSESDGPVAVAPVAGAPLLEAIPVVDDLSQAAPLGEYQDTMPSPSVQPELLTSPDNSNSIPPIALGSSIANRSGAQVPVSVRLGGEDARTPSVGAPDESGRGYFGGLTGERRKTANSSSAGNKDVLLNEIYDGCGPTAAAQCYATLHAVTGGTLTADAALRRTRGSLSNSELWGKWEALVHSVSKAAVPDLTHLERNENSSAEQNVEQQQKPNLELLQHTMEDHGFGEECYRELPNFSRAVELRGAKPLGYSYRVRRLDRAAGVDPHKTAQQAALAEEGGEEKVGQKVFVPVPHHTNPEAINTMFHCHEPKQRKPVLEDHTLLSHPRRATAAGAEDFLVHEQVTSDGLAALLTHVSTFRTFHGAPNPLAGVTFAHLFGSDPDDHATRLTKNVANASMAQLANVVARRHASAGPLIRSGMDVATVCQGALMAEEVRAHIASSRAVLRATDGSVGLGCRLLKEIGAVPVRLPNPLATGSLQAPRVIAALKLLVTPDVFQQIESVVLPLLQARVPTCKKGERISPGAYIPTTLKDRCDELRRAELCGLVHNLKMSRETPIGFVNTQERPAMHNESTKCGSSQAAASFPASLQLLSAIEALLTFAGAIDRLLLLDATAHESFRNDIGGPAILSEAMDFVEAPTSDAFAAFLAQHEVWRYEVAAAELVALPALASACAARATATLRDSTARRALGLILAFEDWSDSFSSEKERPTLLASTDGAAEVREALLVALLHDAAEKKARDVFGSEATEHVGAGDVFTVRVELSASGNQVPDVIVVGTQRVATIEHEPLPRKPWSEFDARRVRRH